MSAPQLSQPQFKVLAIAHSRPQVFSSLVVDPALQPPPFCHRQKPYRPRRPLELCAIGSEPPLAACSRFVSRSFFKTCDQTVCEASCAAGFSATLRTGRHSHPRRLWRKHWDRVAIR